MQRVAQADEQRILGAPAGIVRPAAHEGALLRGVEAGPLGEEGDMHAPLVFRAAARGDAVDHDLALAQRQVALVEQAAAHEALDQALVAGERAEEDERRDARRHQRIEAGGDLGW